MGEGGALSKGRGLGRRGLRRWAWLGRGGRDQGGPPCQVRPGTRWCGAQGPTCGSSSQPPFPKPRQPVKPPAWCPRSRSGLGRSWRAPTLYPEALTCSPLFVRVDFMRTKKERSWTRAEGGASAGLATRARKSQFCAPRGAASPAPPGSGRAPATTARGRTEDAGARRLPSPGRSRGGQVSLPTGTVGTRRAGTGPPWSPPCPRRRAWHRAGAQGRATTHHTRRSRLFREPHCVV